METKAEAVAQKDGQKTRNAPALVRVGLIVVAVVGTAGVSAAVVSWRVQSQAKTVVVVEQAPAQAMNASRSGGGFAAREIYQRAAPGVVLVSALGVGASPSTAELLKGEAGQEGASTGSGFEIDADGTILTNWHVIENAATVAVGVEHHSAVVARVIGEDPSEDIAVLRIPTEGVTLHPLALGDSSVEEVGDPVLAIGNPFGLARTLTTGVISGVQRRIRAPNGVTIDGALQTDAPINPGSSGGPLLNEAGQVIGINSQIETSGSGGGNVGIAFAIPIDTVKRELPKLEKR